MDIYEYILGSRRVGPRFNPLRNQNILMGINLMCSKIKLEIASHIYKCKFDTSSGEVTVAQLVSVCTFVEAKGESQGWRFASQGRGVLREFSNL